MIIPPGANAFAATPMDFAEFLKKPVIPKLSGILTAETPSHGRA